MRAQNGARAAAAAQRQAAAVAPRFTRAAQAERSRLEAKREQLLRTRAAAQAEVARIDSNVAAVDQLLELLAPLLAANGGEPGPGDEDSGAATHGAEPGAQADEAAVRDRAQ